jgi:hypothetical protein
LYRLNNVTYVLLLTVEGALADGFRVKEHELVAQ